MIRCLVGRGAIWELESRTLIAVVRTWRAEWENIVWLSGRRLAARIDWHDSEVAIITYERQGDGR